MSRRILDVVRSSSEVQEVWSEILTLWRDVPEEDKGTVLGSIVKRITIKTKDRVGLRLSPVAELHDPKFVITSHMGAGTGLEPVTFGL